MLNKKGSFNTALEMAYSIWELVDMLFVTVVLILAVNLLTNVDDQSNNLMVKSVIDRLEYCTNHDLVIPELDNCFLNFKHYIKLNYEGVDYVLNTKTGAGELYAYSILVNKNGGYELVDIEFAVTG